MRTIRESLKWSGSGATLSLFVVSATALAFSPTMTYGDIRPARVRTYVLEDEAGILLGRQLTEFDAQFADVPIPLEHYLTSCLEEALRCGCEAAWFGFEGSFDFNHLLAEDVASQIYALGDAKGVEVASDELLASEAWRTTIALARQRLLRLVP